MTQPNTSRSGSATPTEEEVERILDGGPPVVDWDGVSAALRKDLSDSLRAGDKCTRCGGTGFVPDTDVFCECPRGRVLECDYIEDFEEAARDRRESEAEEHREMNGDDEARYVHDTGGVYGATCVHGGLGSYNVWDSDPEIDVVASRRELEMVTGTGELGPEQQDLYEYVQAVHESQVTVNPLYDGDDVGGSDTSATGDGLVTDTGSESSDEDGPGATDVVVASVYRIDSAVDDWSLYKPCMPKPVGVRVCGPAVTVPTEYGRGPPTREPGGWAAGMTGALRKAVASSSSAGYGDGSVEKVLGSDLFKRMADDKGYGPIFDRFAVNWTLSNDARPAIIFPVPFRVGSEYVAGAMWFDPRDIHNIAFAPLYSQTGWDGADKPDFGRVYSHDELYDPQRWKQVPALLRNAVNGGATPQPIPVFPSLGKPWMSGAVGESFAVYASVYAGVRTMSNAHVDKFPCVLEPISGKVFGSAVDSDFAVPVVYLPPVYSWAVVDDVPFGKLAMEWIARHM